MHNVTFAFTLYFSTCKLEAFNTFGFDIKPYEKMNLISFGALISRFITIHDFMKNGNIGRMLNV